MSIGHAWLNLFILSYLWSSIVIRPQVQEIRSISLKDPIPINLNAFFFLNKSWPQRQGQPYFMSDMLWFAFLYQTITTICIPSGNYCLYYMGFVLFMVFTQFVYVTINIKYE